MITGLKIDDEGQVPKYVQIVEGITYAIKKGALKKGEKIPSINELSNEYEVSRVTVEKAYKLLMGKGFIESTKGKGYYVKQTDLDIDFKVLLIFNKLSHYKKEIYNAFIKTIGVKVQVDLKIHHFNVSILNNLVEENLSSYDYFVIMPHFYEDFKAAIEVIKTIPADRLIILDKKIPNFPLKCGAVYQDFENDILDALYENFDLLQKYSKLVMVDNLMIPSPPEKIIGFKKFCMQNKIKYEIISEINMETAVNTGEAYIVTEDTDLANLVKICAGKKLKTGKDVGILSYNETPIKEILLNGITVITTDHFAMGKLAAELILYNSHENIKNKFSVIKRKSL